jgi:hypothetical protein
MREAAFLEDAFELCMRTNLATHLDGSATLLEGVLDGLKQGK